MANFISITENGTPYRINVDQIVAIQEIPKHKKLEIEMGSGRRYTLIDGECAAFLAAVSLKPAAP